MRIELIMEKTEEQIYGELDRELKEIFSIVTEEQRIKALELAMDGYLKATRYIHTATGLSLKFSKAYYDWYIKPGLIGIGTLSQD